MPGHLINTIRVVCASYEDYSHWLLCLQTVSRREGAPLLPSPESFPELRVPTQVRGPQRERLPTAQVLGSGQIGQKVGLSMGRWGEGSHHLPSSLPTPGGPGPGQWPRLALLRWTNQLGLGVPSTPVYPHQPLPP